MPDEVFFDYEDEPNEAFNRITNDVIGAAIAVHRALGPGYNETTYENALIIEFHRRGILYKNQHRFPVMYEGHQVGEGRVDFVVEDLVIVELKACEKLIPLFSSQVISYLKASNLRLAIIINFNAPRLIDGVKRIAL